MADEWLVVVDVQPAFLDAGSPWFSPMLPEAVTRIAELVPLFGARVVFTRFVPPRDVRGSWRPYYARWDFALRPESERLWDVTAPWAGRASVASHRFSKWEVLRPVLGADASVVMCGVSTDCCVLGTAFAAVDDGAQVRVVADACAAKDDVIHERALAILASRAPQLELTTTRAECLRQGAAS